MPNSKFFDVRKGHSNVMRLLFQHWISKLSNGELVVSLRAMITTLYLDTDQLVIVLEPQDAG